MKRQQDIPAPMRICKATLYTERTGRYLDRAQYDTPSSIRGCECPECVRQREYHLHRFEEGTR